MGENSNFEWLQLEIQGLAEESALMKKVLKWVDLSIETVKIAKLGVWGFVNKYQKHQVKTVKHQKKVKNCKNTKF